MMDKRVTNEAGLPAVWLPLNDRLRLCSKEMQSAHPEPLSPTTRGEGTGSTIAQGHLELSPNVVDVVRVRLDLPTEEWTRLTELLTDDERSRAMRFRFDEPRCQFITCRAALRRLLSGCCGLAPTAVPLQYGSHGKPCLAFEGMGSSVPQIEFSVSHSGDFGLIALTIGVPVGIDIEEINPRVETLRLAERFFARAETRELCDLPTDDQTAGFYRGWTCKEAYIKATGRGLSMPLDSFAVTIDPRKPASLRWVDQQPEEPSTWTVRSLDIAPNYAAAVMVAQSECRIRCWDWESI